MMSVLRVPLRAMKKVIRNGALKVLEKTDDGFFLSYRTSAHSGFDTRDLSLTHENANITKPKPSSFLVLNESGAISDENTLEFLFQAIFDGSPPKGVGAVLWDRARMARCGTHEELVKELKKFTLQKIQDDSDGAAEWTLCLNQICQHIEESKTNKLAYSTEGSAPASTIFWPDPSDSSNGRNLFSEIPKVGAFPILDKETPIGSAGSCFAMEIAHRLQADGFNYIVTEPYLHPTKKFSNSCARWGTIFNTPSFRQLIEFALLNKDRPKIVWTFSKGGKQKVFDPFREDIEFDSEVEYLSSYEDHRIAAKKALTQAKVFVLTLGMNEVWQFKGGNEYCSRSPWRIASYVVRKKILSVEENLAELQKMLDIWRAFNPELKLIVSVSPVPLHATFRANQQHIIAANCHSKSTLRIVADEFVRRNKNVFYFPSYETVMYCTKNAWLEDQRHVSPEAVSNVMKLFGSMFVEGGELR